jgi:spermidine synthase
MFDIKSVPKIVIREGELNSVKIVESEDVYELYIDNVRWNLVNTKDTLELREFYSSYDLAQGNVLLSGFGFGILPQWIASKQSVSSVTVIEWNKDVVNLFIRHNTLNPKVNVVIADIKKYKDDFCYDWAILDHYEIERIPTKEEFDLLSSNINFNNLWFWSLERRLTQYESWEKFRQKYSLKIPDLSIDKVMNYMETLFKRRDFHL